MERCSRPTEIMSSSITGINLWQRALQEKKCIQHLILTNADIRYGYFQLLCGRSKVTARMWNVMYEMSFVFYNLMEKKSIIHSEERCHQANLKLNLAFQTYYRLLAHWERCKLNGIRQRKAQFSIFLLNRLFEIKIHNWKAV